MQTNEEKLCSFTQKGTRLQLLKLTYIHYTSYGEYQYTDIKYQVRLNRKIIKKSISEYEIRKLFAMYVQNIVLQLKIY